MSTNSFLLLLLSLILLLLYSNCTRSGIYHDDNGNGKTVLIDTLSKKQQRIIKEEMLNVLGLEKEPKVNRKGSPPPQYMLDLYQEFSLQADSEVTDANHRYGEKQNKKQPDLVISFVNHVRKHPYHGHRRHDRSHLYYFDFSEVPATEDVCRADFRVYKAPARGTQGDEEDERMSIVLYRLVKDSLDEEPHFEVESNTTVRGAFDGWLDFNITRAATQWTYFPNTNLGLYLDILDNTGREVSPRDAGIVGRKGAGDLQPFLVAYFRSSNPPPVRSRRDTSSSTEQRNRERSKRQTNDVSYIDNPLIKYMPMLRKSCNKEALYVSFQDLKWQEWIISPKGYAAFYCQGHCRFPLNSHMNATNHAIVQTLLHTKRASIPEPCCAPTKLSPISVLYFDERNNVILKNYQHMVVKACGCY